MDIIAFRFYLNHNLGLSNHEFLKMNFEGKKVYIGAQKMQSISTIPFKGNSTNFKIGKTKIISTKIEGAASWQSLHIPNNEEHKFEDTFKHGYKLTCINNLVSIILEVESNSNIIDNREIAKRCLKRFIQIHSYYSNIGLVNNLLGKTPISDYFLGKNKTLDSLENGTFLGDEYNYELEFELPLKENSDSFSLSKPIKTKIEKRLLIDQNLEPYELILLDAKRKFAEKDYSLALVQIETSFETFIQSIIRKLCIACNRETISNNRRTQSPINEVLETANIKKPLIKYNLNELLNPQSLIQESREYTLWESKTYDLRNKVIHRGHTAFTEQEVIDSFKSMKVFHDYIKQLAKPILNPE